MRLARRRDLVLLHRLQQRRLGLWRRAVHLVGEYDVREHRPFHEPEGAFPAALLLLDDLRAGDVRRHEIGGELDARKLEVERLGHGLDHEGLREPGHAEQEGVAAREDGREDAVEHLLLADDAAADLSEQVGARGGEPLEELNVALGRA